jgi:DNA-binding NarL/FixJ family response regulator
MASAAAAAITVHAALRIVPRPIRVLTVDGQQLVQEGLAAMINREEDMTVVATASSGEEAIDDVRRYRPDVVTLDLLLPDMPGEELAQRILTEFPRTRIVAITSAQGHTHARRALDAGVHGYLSKAAPGSELVRAIRQVEAGAKMIPGPVPLKIAEHTTHQALTTREIQVLQLVAWGNGNKQVAAQLSIASETVRMHMRNILEKLAANDRTHAVTIAAARGILRLGEGSMTPAWQGNSNA